MKFIPYLHAAFVRYHRDGLPPFRALVMDYPEDIQGQTISDEYLMGDSMLVAPVVAGTSERSVLSQAGEWHDFWTGERHSGRQRINIRVPFDRIPLFVKTGTVLPLAQPTLHTEDPASWELTALVFGDGSQAARLFEDDGSFNPALNPVTLTWDNAAGAGRIAGIGLTGKPKYSVTE